MDVRPVCALLLALALAGAAAWPGAEPGQELDRARRLVEAGRDAEARELLLRLLEGDPEQPQARASTSGWATTARSGGSRCGGRVGGARSSTA